MDEELPTYLELDRKHNIIFQDHVNNKLNHLEQMVNSHEKELIVLWLVLAIDIALFLGMVARAKKISEGTNE